MAESSGEKTEEPTPQKLRKAREKGQVAKSQDFVSAVGFAGSFAVLALSLSMTANLFFDLVQECVRVTAAPDLSKAVQFALLKSFKVSLLASLPVLGAAFVLGLAMNFAQVGFLFTTEPLKPSFDKLNPVNGVKQMFSSKRLVEVLKQIIKFSVVGIIVYFTVKSYLHNMVMMQRLRLDQSLGIAGGMISDLCIKVAVLFLLIAAADFFIQRRIFKKSMMMTKSEIKQEYKESEGDPELKGERKRLAQEILMHGSQQRVKTSDAVVTNPTHIAVAIEYDQKRHSAPVVVCKGLGLNADKIRELAVQNDIPILRNVPLAQALNKIELDEEIPEDLYEAVAEVLNFVYELKGKKTQ